jgi:trehalose-phosphatase
MFEVLAGEAMKHLLEDWENVQNRIREAQTLFLFLDYDGTLTPIESSPELAFCPQEVRLLLGKLRDLPKVYPAIISGRYLEDIREKVGVSGITYVGNHGLSIQNPVGIHKKKLSPTRRKEFDILSQALKESLGQIPGILFEDKGLILAIHYRNVAQEYFVRIHNTIEETLEKWKERWKIAYGKMVYEVQPNVDFNKGKAVRDILKSYPPFGLLSIYLGDDLTDEDAFRALKGRGITVFVGPGWLKSEAEYYLKDPGQVQEFLHRCEENLRKCSHRLKTLEK